MEENKEIDIIFSNSAIIKENTQFWTIWKCYPIGRIEESCDWSLKKKFDQNGPEVVYQQYYVYLRKRR